MTIIECFRKITAKAILLKADLLFSQPVGGFLIFPEERRFLTGFTFESPQQRAENSNKKDLVKLETTDHPCKLY